MVATEAPCDIADGEVCQHGVCVDACSEAVVGNSYVGCEYVAVDLPNCQQASGLSPRDAQFAVVISNGDDRNAAQVEVFGLGDDVSPVLSTTVPPHDLVVLQLNQAVPQSQTNIEGTGVYSARAFHIVSNLPVTAYQFNPLNNTDAAYSNDASLLLPISALDRDYIAATGDGVVGGDDTDGDGMQDITYDWGAFVTVIAIQDGTEVTMAPSNDILPGGDIPGGREEITVTLDRFDVLNVESRPSGAERPTPGDANLSGTLVRASQPVAVFSGNVATVIPNPDAPCCADHLEEQVIPLSAWGQRFVVARGLGRRQEGDWEPEFYRITGGNPPLGQEVITISYEPYIPEGAPTELGQGESVEFSSASDFVVDADGPLLITSYFVSSYVSAPEIDLQNPFSIQPCFSQAECNGLPYAAVCVMGIFGGSCMPVGDPSMTIIPPVEQYRDAYVFLTPLDYAFDAITVIAPVGVAVYLDDSLMEQPAAIGDIDGRPYGAIRTLVTDGTHHLRADAGAEVGLIVYGMDKDVSYGYPGGLDLEIINPLE